MMEICEDKVVCERQEKVDSLPHNPVKTMQSNSVVKVLAVC